MLATTLFFATLLCSLFTAGSAAANTTAITVANAQNLIQCSEAVLGWTSNGSPRYTVEVYTGCDDSNEDPIFSWTGPNPTVNWYVNLVSGSSCFYSVMDATGAVYYSAGLFVGGSAGGDATACATKIKDDNLAVESASQSSTASGTTPTTASSSAPTGLNGVANAEATTTAASAVGKAQGSISGAGVNAAPSMQLALGLLGAGLLALL